eukprot:SAG11_NODE_218_length_12212_cov_7.026005_4_plen_65_part_00
MVRLVNAMYQYIHTCRYQQLSGVLVVRQGRLQNKHNEQTSRGSTGLIHHAMHTAMHALKHVKML